MRTLAWLGLPLLVAACDAPPEPSVEQPEPALAKRDLSSAPAPPEPTPIERPLGSYRHEHTVMVVCEDPDWCPQQVTDTLEIAAADDGAIAIEVQLVQANGHNCHFRDTLTPAGERLWEWRAAEGKPECHLQLRWEPESLKLSSEGCRDFCGMRAHLDAEFPYSGD